MTQAKRLATIQTDNLAQSIEAAIRWSSPQKRGGYAIVRDPQGEKVFDSRESIK
jgi:hypothetical protein